jgi:hypothetical protein
MLSKLKSKTTDVNVDVEEKGRDGEAAGKGGEARAKVSHRTTIEKGGPARSRKKVQSIHLLVYDFVPV